MEKWELEFYYSPLTKGELSIYDQKVNFICKMMKKIIFYI